MNPVFARAHVRVDIRGDELRGRNIFKSRAVKVPMVMPEGGRGWQLKFGQVRTRTHTPCRAFRSTRAVVLPPALSDVTGDRATNGAIRSDSHARGVRVQGCWAVEVGAWFRSADWNSSKSKNSEVKS